MVVIDQLQLFNGTQRNVNRAQELTTITRGFKNLAHEERIPVLALSAFNRESMKRPDGRPILSDFKDSGSIESDGNIVIGLYSEWAFSKGASGDASAIEVHVLKARDARTDVVRARFRREAGSFEADDVVPFPDDDDDRRRLAAGDRP